MSDKTGMFRAQRSDGQGVVEGYYSGLYDHHFIDCEDPEYGDGWIKHHKIDPNTLEYLGNQEGIGYIDNECFDEFYGHSYSCPACKHSIIGKQNYCENCGKRLNDKGD